MEMTITFSVIYIGTKNPKNMADSTAELWSCGSHAA